MNLKATIGLTTALLLSLALNAQRRPGRTQQAPVTTASAPTYNGLPLIIDSAAIMDTGRSPYSLRPITAFNSKPEGKRVPLELEPLRWDDALYSEKVWRELDLREKINQTFRYDGQDENGSQLFVNILLKAVRSGELQAFRDDRFSIPVTPAQVNDICLGRLDTVPRYNPSTMVPDAYIVTRANFDPNSITKLLLMEEWVFDSKGSRLHSRILGVAPLKTRQLPGGKQQEASSIMFWLSYGDLRPILANAEVYNPKNMGRSRMTWEELFEARMFSSYITKSTLENPLNRTIRSYIKDPVLALLEGENVKEKIFNYEQGLWSH